MMPLLFTTVAPLLTINRLNAPLLPMNRSYAFDQNEPPPAISARLLVEVELAPSTDDAEPPPPRTSSVCPLVMSNWLPGPSIPMKRLEATTMLLTPSRASQMAGVAPL